MKVKRRRLPLGLTVEQEAPDRWAVVHVVGPLMGGFTNVVYKARGATRNQAIAHYKRGGYAMDDYGDSFKQSVFDALNNSGTCFQIAKSMPRKRSPR